jgi:molybdopterin synthase catalytic subunit
VSQDARTIAVHYYAAARDLCGRETDALEVGVEGLTVDEALAALGRRHERFAALAHRMRAAVNGEIAAGSQRVHAGDSIDVLPPLAGGSMGVHLARVQDAPLSVDAVLAQVAHEGAGGIAIFLGTVRNHADGKPVERLDYEAHPQLAVREIEAIERDVAQQHADARVCIVHRTGALQLGELAVIVAASAPHREEAFAACRLAIEEVKKRVPVWKKEWHPGGEATWVNLAPK